MKNKTDMEKYNLLHDEIMKRLDDGEITTEQAKEMNNRFFDKYITESFKDLYLKMYNAVSYFKYKDVTYECIDIDINKFDVVTKQRINDYKELIKKANNDLKKAVSDTIKEFNGNIEVKYKNPSSLVNGWKTYKKDKASNKIEINIHGISVDFKFKNKDVSKEKFMNSLENKLYTFKQNKPYSDIIKKYKGTRIFMSCDATADREVNNIEGMDIEAYCFISFNTKNYKSEDKENVK